MKGSETGYAFYISGERERTSGVVIGRKGKRRNHPEDIYQGDQQLGFGGGRGCTDGKIKWTILSRQVVNENLDGGASNSQLQSNVRGRPGSGGGLHALACGGV